MGALCSKPSVERPQRVVLGSSGPQPSDRPVDPRQAAAAAAERRLEAAKSRGVVKTNPNSGELSGKLEASKKAARAPEARPEERLVWD